MEHFAQFIWKLWKGKSWGWLIAGLLIGGAFGLSASVSLSHDTATIIAYSVAAAFIGGIASLILEFRDRRREASPEWQQKVNKTEHEIQQMNPNVPPVVVRSVAVSKEQQRFTPLVWIGVVVGALSAGCGILAFILKIVSLLR